MHVGTSDAAAPHSSVGKSGLWMCGVTWKVQSRFTAPQLLLPTASEAAMNAIHSLALILTPTPTS